MTRIEANAIAVLQRTAERNPVPGRASATRFGPGAAPC